MMDEELAQLRRERDEARAALQEAIAERNLARAERDETKAILSAFRGLGGPA